MYQEPPYHLEKVLDPRDGSVLLFDIYVRGAWVGSRRTWQQCMDRIKFLLADDIRIERETRQSEAMEFSNAP